MQPPPATAATATTPPAAQPQVAGGRGRIEGVDLARGLAIVGMMMVHFAPPLAGDGGWYGIPYGRASAMFALVAGMGITLAGTRTSLGDQRARLLWRTAWLLPLGLWLQTLDHPVAVILQYYAVWFALCVPVLHLRTRTVAALAGLVTLVGGSVLVWAQVEHPAWYAPGRGVLAGQAGDVLLTGYYPTVSWVGLVWAGIALGRLDLRGRRTPWLLLGGGTLVACSTYAAAWVLRSVVDLGRWQPWLDTGGHADTPLEMLASGAVATAVVGLCILVARGAGWLVGPGVAFGRFALTTYVGHIVLYAAIRPTLQQETAAGGLVATAVVSAGFTLLAVLWLLVAERGPLEALDRAGFRRVVLPVVEAVRGTTGTPSA